jgi:serine protease
LPFRQDGHAITDTFVARVDPGLNSWRYAVEVMGMPRSFAPAARALLALVAATVVTLAVGASAATPAALDQTNPKHFFWAPGQSPLGTVDSVENNLIYKGGNAGSGAIGVEIKPAVYLVYWGQQWATGFTTNDDDVLEHDAPNDLNSFFQTVGGSPWAGVQTQYCRNVPAGTTSCAGLPGAEYVTNPKRQLKASLDRPDSGARRHRDARPGGEPRRRSDRHGGAARRGAFQVRPERDVHRDDATPNDRHGQPVYCGYHTQTTSINGLGNPFRIQYSFIRFLNADWPGLGSDDCGMHNVNATSNAFRLERRSDE